MASDNNLFSAEGECVLDDDDDDDDGVPEDEDDDEEEDVEEKILQLQDQFQEVKQQRKEARLVSTHSPNPQPTHWFFVDGRGGGVVVALRAFFPTSLFPHRRITIAHGRGVHVSWCVDDAPLRTCRCIFTVFFTLCCSPRHPRADFQLSGCDVC